MTENSHINEGRVWYALRHGVPTLIYIGYHMQEIFAELFTKLFLPPYLTLGPRAALGRPFEQA